MFYINSKPDFILHKVNIILANWFPVYCSSIDFMQVSSKPAQNQLL